MITFRYKKLETFSDVKSIHWADISNISRPYDMWFNNDSRLAWQFDTIAERHYVYSTISYIFANYNVAYLNKNYVPDITCVIPDFSINDSNDFSRVPNPLRTRDSSEPSLLRVSFRYGDKMANNVSLQKPITYSEYSMLTASPAPSMVAGNNLYEYSDMIVNRISFLTSDGGKYDWHLCGDEYKHVSDKIKYAVDRFLSKVDKMHLKLKIEYLIQPYLRKGFSKDTSTLYECYFDCYYRKYEVKRVYKYTSVTKCTEEDKLLSIRFKPIHLGLWDERVPKWLFTSVAERDHVIDDILKWQKQVDYSCGHFNAGSITIEPFTRPNDKAKYTDLMTMINKHARQSVPSPFMLMSDKAYELLFNSKRLCRLGWNGKDMFIFLVPGSRFSVTPGKPLNKFYKEGTLINYHAHLDMKTADGTIVPWSASQTDILANDWVEYIQPQV